MSVETQPAVSEGDFNPDWVDGFDDLGACQLGETPLEATIIPFPNSAPDLEQESIEPALLPGQEFNRAVIAWMATAEYSFMNRLRERF